MCSEPGCQKKYHARGLCTSHYWSRYLSASGRRNGGLPGRSSRDGLDWDENEYESFWQFVKKELNLV
jgi:hypothetical protein